jgi:predicted ABC-type sugar transport system permease subunit
MPPARRTTVARVERSSGRDWQKTAMVIGGSTAAGAGLGAVFGGKKGALIGAAISGGASALYEVNHR